jgi:putative nucleotidyltransferase with HDIG domain
MGDASNRSQERPLAFDPDAAPEDLERIRELLPELELIEDLEARDMVARLWAHSWRVSEWADPSDAFMTIGRLPAGHDPYLERWNQIEHTRAVVVMAGDMLPTIEGHVGCPVDRQVAFIAALLHDVAKLPEYSPGGDDGPVKTPIGAVLHHAAIGAQWALEAGFGPDVAHAIVAHSPSVSAEPSTPEALLVKAADQVVTDFNRLRTGLEAS